MELVFASNNQNKVSEVQNMLGSLITIKSLSDINCTVDIPETGNTIEENAKQKSEYVFNHYGISCFADDTGLEIDALNGEPGVYSARYAGEEKDAQKNMQLVLSNLEGVSNRRARFKTIISLILDGKEYSFEGIVEGEICNCASGGGGFGYDPIFKPKGYTQTFAELSSEEKNTISHRALAVKKLVDFLHAQIQ